jgi:hypothetical protein
MILTLISISKILKLSDNIVGFYVHSKKWYSMKRPKNRAAKIQVQLVLPFFFNNPLIHSDEVMHSLQNPTIG